MKISIDAIVAESERIALDHDLDRMTSVMWVLLEYIRDEPVPPAVIAPVELAEDYWKRGVGSAEDLDAARVSLWKYLDRAHPGHGARSPAEVRACRRVIGVLYPELNEDALNDTIEFFVVLTRGICNT